jgi:hypothetical protein
MDPTPKPPPALPMVGADAYRWAWLRHGPLLPYVRAQTLDLYAAQLYPRGVEGWVNGRLTIRAGAYWAQRATTEELAQAEAQAIDEAPAHLLPHLCPACDGMPLKDPARPCLPCFGTGLLHALQPQPILRPLP